MSTLLEIVRDNEQATIVRRYIRDNMSKAGEQKIKEDWWELLTPSDQIAYEGQDFDLDEVLEDYFDQPHFDPYEFGEEHGIDWRGLEESYGIEGR